MMTGTGRTVGFGLAALLAVGCGGYDAASGGDDCDDCWAWEVEEGDVEPTPETKDEDEDLDEVEAAMVACAPEALDRDSTGWLEVTERKWEGDRLLRRVEVTESQGVEEQRVFEWTYDDDGRLVEATTQVDGELMAQSSWTYADGRPVQVERRLFGVAVERQSWSYDGDALVGRRLEVASRGLDESLEPDVAPVNLARDSVGIHDTYAQRPDERYSWTPGERHSPWVDANAHRSPLESEECYLLPASPGHGYPEDEASYHLGLDTDYGPDATGLSYGYGYAGYDPREWYGHVGIATSWPYSWYGQHQRFEVELEYDEQGRMIFEELSYQPRPENDTVVVERKRHFDERGLATDFIVVKHDGETSNAELLFERDAEGNLLLRERFHEGERVSFQDWHYEDGEAVRLDVYAEVVSSMWSPYMPNPGPDSLVHDMESTTEHVATYERQ